MPKENSNPAKRRVRLAGFEFLDGNTLSSILATVSNLIAHLAGLVPGPGPVLGAGCQS